MAEADDEAAEGDSLGAKLEFEQLATSQNIVALLEEEQLAKIGQWVVADFDLDEESRSDWYRHNEEAIKLATMMVAEEKTFPFDGAANVKYPLIATAALQFNARAYPAICPAEGPVRGKVNGKDPTGEKQKRADRVADFMSWQLTSQMPEWEEDTDRLTLIVSITGAIFRKVYFDPALKRNVTRLVTCDRLVYNYWARSFLDLPRITEKLFLYPYEVQERITSARFVEFDYDDQPKGDTSAKSQDAEKAAAIQDRDGQMLFLEQHRLLDLDGDGYPEPYVVTVHHASGAVCRIIANWTADDVVVAHKPNADGTATIDRIVSIRKRDYYIRYTFLPSPDGGAYGMGFGWLLNHTNESINTTINMMFDAGALSNMQGGFVSASMGLRDKTIRLGLGEFKVLPASDLSHGIVPIKYDGPSPVLFQLLQFLIETGKELAAVKDVLTGDTQHANAPVGTTLALIEQGLQVFTSIYKRIHRGLTAELRLLADLNRTNVTPEEYNAFFDDQQQQYDPAADFDLKDMDIVPVSDPASVTRQQKIAKAQAEMQIGAGNPAIDQAQLTRRMYEAVGTEDIDSLFLPPPPPPDPEQVDLLRRAAVAEVEKKEAEVESEIASATSALSTAWANAAKAAGMPEQQAAAALDQWLKMLDMQHGMEMDVAGQQQALAEQGGVQGMAPEPGNGMGAGPAAGAGGSAAGGPPDGTGQLAAVPPGAMGNGAAAPQLPQGAL